MSDLDKLISKFELNKYKHEILSANIPCIEGFSISGEVDIGQSKVGGLPHLPNGYSWPYFKNIPLEFIAQVNCSDFEYDGFPDSGLIVFFYDNRHGGYSIKEKGFIKVDYFPDSTNLELFKPPFIIKKRLFGLLGTYTLPKIYKETKIGFRKSFSLPDNVDKVFSDENWEEAYWELNGEVSENRFIQIGGHCNPVQTDGIEENIVKLFERGKPSDWKMILEIYQDEETDMMWGDAGKLHFYSHVDDLREMNFSNTWMEMQCG